MDAFSVIAVAFWDILLPAAGLILILAAVIWLQLWANRRRQSGVEASTYEPDGAEVILRHPGHSGQ